MNRQQARSRVIAQVLTRHGFGYALAHLGLQRWMPAGRAPSGGAVRPEHLRLALEELGPTAVKLGQILSTRPDLLPPDIEQELARLQDTAPPVAADDIRAAMTAELGAAPEEVFGSFDMTPLASASIGQAHAATLKDGTEVVVKVRRPGAVEQVADGLEIMHNLAAYASRHWDVAARTDVVGLVDEFSASLRAELDYLREGRDAGDAVRFGGREAVFSAIMAGVLVPTTALAIPLYLLFSKAGLTDTRWAVPLPSMVSPFGVYLSRVHITAAVPEEMLEAARLDGASEYRIFFTMVLRVMSPALVTVFLFQLVAVWNNFLLPLIMLSNDRLYPVTLGLYTWNSQVLHYPELNALIVTGSLVSVIPLVVAFLGLQRYWRPGLSSGSAK